MVNAGIFYCLNCGKLSHDSFYQDPQRKVGILLKRKRLVHTPGKKELMKLRRGLSSGLKRKLLADYAAYPCTPALEPKPETTPATLVDVDLSNRIPGVPKRISVKFDGSDEIVEMGRACPYCGFVPQAYCSDIGTHPLYVILMVGKTSAGKSTWLESIRSQSHLTQLNDSHCYPVVIMSSDHRGDINDNVAGTVQGTLGETVYLKLKERDADGNLRQRASVVLIDVAGESYKDLFQKNEVDRLRLRSLLGEGVNRLGVDGIMFFEGATSDNEDARICADVSQAVGNWDELPVACVRTHLDELLKNPKQLTRNGTILLSDTTFARAKYNPTDLLERFQKQHLVGRQLGHVAKGDVESANRKCFLVQSCSSSKKTTTDIGANVAVADYRNSRNVLDPLIWMLYRLRAYPIPLTEEEANSWEAVR